MPYCTKCSKTAQGNFCTTCGSKLVAAPPSSSGSSTGFGGTTSSTSPRFGASSSTSTRFGASSSPSPRYGAKAASPRFGASSASASSGSSGIGARAAKFGGSGSSSPRFGSKPASPKSTGPTWKERQEQRKKEEEEKRRRDEEERKKREEAEAKRRQEAQRKQDELRRRRDEEQRKAKEEAERRRKELESQRKIEAEAKRKREEEARKQQAARTTPSSFSHTPTKAPMWGNKGSLATSTTKASANTKGLDLEGLVETKSPTTGPARARPAGARKRHSKIEMENAPSSTRGLNVEGLDNKPKPAGKGGLAARWQQQMQDRQNEDFQKNRDKLRGRRRGGVAFMDKQIRDLIVEIKKIARPSGGLGQITFGELFTATDTRMPALSATLACAQKRGVVKYQGALLMQGASDGVMITLVKEQIDDTPDFQTIIGKGPIKFTGQTPSSRSQCTVCKKPVYPADRIAPNDQVMHKTCFRCATCNKVLKLAAYAYGGGKFYCEPHFEEMVRKNKGYNF